MNYTHKYSITAADMDTRYRMTPNAALLYYQDCWARFMACLHLAAFDMVKVNRMWVITEFNAFFEEETALWSEEIEVEVWNSELSALRLYAEFRFRRPDGKEVAHGYGCWTLLDTEAHRLAPLTPFAEQIPVVAEMTTESHKKMRFAKPSEISHQPSEGSLQIPEIKHRVNPINLDFNGHVNNRTYLSIAMQQADEAFLDAHAIRRIAIHWLRETFLGDTLTCSYEPSEVSHQSSEGSDQQALGVLANLTREDGELSAQIYTEWAPRTIATDIAAQAPRD